MKIAASDIALMTRDNQTTILRARSIDIDQDTGRVTMSFDDDGVEIVVSLSAITAWEISEDLPLPADQ